MTPADESGIQDLKALYKQWGWIGVAAGVSYLLLKLWQSGAVDSWLNIAVPKLQWDARSRWWRLGAVYIVSALAATLGGVAAGQSWLSAAFAGLLAAVSAIGIHETGQTVKKAIADGREVYTTPPAKDSESIRTKLDLKRPEPSALDRPDANI